MKNKKIILAVILLVFFVFSIVIYLLIFKTNKNDFKSDDNYIVESLRRPKGDTSLDLISKAYQEKKIEYETYLLYKVQATFGDPNLPSEYASKYTAFEDQGILNEIKENYDSLSDETKKLLVPYFKRPNDLDSYWAKAINPVEKSSFHFIETANAYDRPNSYKSETELVTADGKIKVWYIEQTVGTGSSAVKKKIYYDVAKKIVENLNKDTAYSRFKRLLQTVQPSDGTLGGDDKLDIYIAAGTQEHLTDTGGPSLGVNVPDNGTGNSSYVIIRNNLKDKELKTTTVHEIFHVFQRAFTCKMIIKNYWWIEGTATWSEDFIYSKENTEHEWIDDFIPKPEVILTKADGKHEYGAYVFPFYLSQKYNDDAIRKVFRGCDLDFTPLNSVDKNIDGGFKKNWKEFTLWNYNKKPAIYYKDKSGKFPKDSSDEGGNTDMPIIAGIGETNIDFKELESLTSQVVDTNIINDDGKIKKLVYKNLKNFIGKSDKAGIKAVIYPVGSAKPYIEDWTDKEQRAFCFDKENENIKRVVIITSNAELKNKISKTIIKTKTKTSCYDIDQSEVLTAKPLFALSPNYVGTINFSADGLVDIGTVSKDAKYAYLGKWKVDVKYSEKWPAQNIMGLSATNMDFKYDHKLEFDLSSVKEDGSFTIDVQAGKFETPGWDVINNISGDVTNIPQNTTGWDISQQKGVIYDMTETGAKVKLPESVLYNSGGYRTLPKPFILEIKKN